MKRREFLGLSVTATAVAVMGGLPTIAFADAAEDAKKAENAKKALAEVKTMFGSDAVTVSDKVMLKAPDIAENGLAVPITVGTELAGAKRMAVFIDSNPTTLTTAWKMTAAMKPEVQTRVKMGGTGVVMVVVEGADGKLYSASKEVKVTVGGCGG